MDLHRFAYNALEIYWPWGRAGPARCLPWTVPLPSCWSDRAMTVPRARVRPKAQAMGCWADPKARWVTGPKSYQASSRSIFPFFNYQASAWAFGTTEPIGSVLRYPL